MERKHRKWGGCTGLGLCIALVSVPAWGSPIPWNLAVTAAGLIAGLPGARAGTRPSFGYREPQQPVRLRVRDIPSLGVGRTRLAERWLQAEGAWGGGGSWKISVGLMAPSESPATVTGDVLRTEPTGGNRNQAGGEGMAPEPASLMLFGTGLVLLGGLVRKRTQAADLHHRQKVLAAGTALVGNSLDLAGIGNGDDLTDASLEFAVGKHGSQALEATRIALHP